MIEPEVVAMAMGELAREWLATCSPAAVEVEEKEYPRSTAMHATRCLIAGTNVPKTEACLSYGGFSYWCRSSHIADCTKLIYGLILAMKWDGRVNDGIGND